MTMTVLLQADTITILSLRMATPLLDDSAPRDDFTGMKS